MITKNTLFIILSFFAGLTIMFVFNRQAINILREQKNTCESESMKKSSIVSTRPLTKQEIFILADKAKKMDQYKPMKLNYTSQITKGEKGDMTIVIMVEGPQEALFDAADLRIDFTEGIRILDVQKGSAFSSYPQISVKGASIIATGIASVTDKGIEYGYIKKPFVTIQARQLQKTGRMIINKEDSNIYLMGETVFDKENNKNDIL